MWKEIALELEEIYGAYVEYEEGFFICPECGEPVYKEDWDDGDFEDCKCPICQWNGD